MAFKKSGDWNRALVEFLKASQQNPRLARAFYEQALIFREQGYSKLAESALGQALAVSDSIKADKRQSARYRSISEKDLAQIRLLLATVRLEQGNF
ncbi:MAG TPA: hypothetical protein V6D17_25200, partial [Candidatus Obscuribacterales bacterium]